MNSPLLINESPMLVLPTLAALVGLNEAIVLQQVQFWAGRGYGVEHEGRRWIHNTVQEWAAQFPFWSEKTVARTLKDLRDRGLIDVAQLAPNPWDKTHYYAINYDRLNALVAENEAPHLVPIDAPTLSPSIGTTCPNRYTPDCPNRSGQSAHIIPTEKTQRLTDTESTEKESLKEKSTLSTKGALTTPRTSTTPSASPEIPQAPSTTPRSKRRSTAKAQATEAVKALLRAYRRGIGANSEEPTASDLDAYATRLARSAEAGVTPEQFETATRAAVAHWTPQFITPRSIANNLPDLLAKSASVQYNCTTGIQNANKDEKQNAESTNRPGASRVVPKQAGSGQTRHQPSAAALALQQQLEA